MDGSNVAVGINGFGRMGRLALRAAWGWSELRFTHVNELHGDADTAAHLLKFDSVHGRWDRNVGGGDGSLTIDGERIGYSREGEPGDVPWDELGVEVVLECSGQFRSLDSLKAYFRRGVRKVIVAAPVRDAAALNLVVGVNDNLYDPAEHDLVTAASCTTNCLAPVVKVIHEGIGIEHGSITTLHDMTNTQNVVDAPHKDLRRARSASMSLIPTTTGSATAIGLIFPELEGKLNGLAVRVPLMNSSITDCVFEVARPTTVEEVNGLLAQAADGALAGILGYEERPLVSVDYRDDPRSGIVDAPSTMVIGRNPGEGPGLVRQRVGLREPTGGAGAEGRSQPSDRRSLWIRASNRLAPGGERGRNHGENRGPTCGATRWSPGRIGQTRWSTARAACWSSSTSTSSGTAPSSWRRCFSSTSSSASSPI